MRIALFLIHTIMATFILGVTWLSAESPHLFCDKPGHASEGCCAKCHSRFKTCETEEKHELARESKCFELYTQCNESCKSEASS